jgi:ribosomal protein S26
MRGRSPAFKARTPPGILQYGALQKMDKKTGEDPNIKKEKKTGIFHICAECGRAIPRDKEFTIIKAGEPIKYVHEKCADLLADRG